MISRAEDGCGQVGQSWPGPAAALAGKATDALLTGQNVDRDAIDLVIAGPLTAAFLDALPGHLGIADDRLVTAPRGRRVHTASLLVALATAQRTGRLSEAHRVLLVSAGAGLVAGAALLVR